MRLQCSKCEEVKSVKEFYKDKSKASGYRSHCKECIKEARLADYHEKFQSSHEFRRCERLRKQVDYWRKKACNG